VALALALRLSLDAVWGSRFPLTTFYAAAMLAARACGRPRRTCPLSDLGMPDADGFELMRAVQDRERRRGDAPVPPWPSRPMRAVRIVPALSRPASMSPR
jgi:CheY-like chemotaxis protein